MSSPEHNIESLVIAVLGEHATFSGVNIEHHSADASTVEKANRLIVKCDAPNSDIKARKTTLPPYSWQAQVTVTAVAKSAKDTWDNWRAAIDEALLADASQDVKDTADSLFSWVETETPDGGGEDEGPDKRRTFTRSFRVLFTHLAS